MFQLRDFTDCDNARPIAHGVASVPAGSCPILRIVIPAKNEEAQIAATIVALCAHFGDRATILVVANACTDRTTDIVRGLALIYHNVQLLEIAAPIGKGGAVRAGLKIGSEPYIAFVDADGSTRPDQVDVLLARCRDDGLSGVIGSRWLPESTISRRQPLRRRIASRAFNMLVRIMFGLPFSDTQCGAKVFERKSVDRVLERLEIANFAFDVDLLVALRRLRCRVIEIPIAWGDVPEYSKVVLIRSGSSMFWALLRLLVRNSGLRNLPWADLLARSSVIPVKPGLKFLALHTKKPLETRQQDLLDEIVKQGHEVDLQRLSGPLDVARFAWTYVKSGHRTYDVLIDFVRENGSYLSAFSTKPKIYSSSIDGLTMHEISTLIERTARRCGYSAFFWRFEHGWMLSSSRVETILQEAQ